MIEYMLDMTEYVLREIGLYRKADEPIHFGHYETFLEVSLTLNLIFFAFRGPVDKFISSQAKVTSWVVKMACGWATILSKRPEELGERLVASEKRLYRAASCIVFVCRLCLPVVAITTLWGLAAYESNELVSRYEYWAILLMSAPIIFGVVALYLTHLVVVLWHLIVALLITLYFFNTIKETVKESRKKRVIASASKVVKARRGINQVSGDDQVPGDENEK